MVNTNSLATAMQHGISHMFETFGVNCPVCGQPLYRPKTVNKQTGQKMAGACPNCRYMQPAGTKNIPNANQLTIQAHKNDALGYLNTYSMFSNFKIFNHRFENFKAVTADEKRVLAFCRRTAQKIIDGDVVHSLMLGTVGLGKTHLAVGMLYDILEKTNYQHPDHSVWRIMFIDWRDLLVENKQAFNDEQIANRVNGTMNEIKHADVVILDDFGSERKTDYAYDLADEFWRCREDKNVITTSNLTGQRLPNLYGDRMISRMKKHGAGNSIEFKGDDHRGKL